MNVSVNSMAVQIVAWPRNARYEVHYLPCYPETITNEVGKAAWVPNFR